MYYKDASEASGESGPRPPLAADRAAPDARGRPATPTARVYPGGARRRQRMAGRRPTGRGGGPPTHPLPAPPPQLGNHRSDPPPPRSRGGAPPPPEGTATRGGGGCGWTRTPRAPVPPAAPAGVAAAGRAHTSVPEQRADQAWGRRTAAHQNSMEAAPHMTLP